MSTLGARGVMETTNPDTANYYLRFGWKLLSQYTIPATQDAPEKVRYVLAAIAGIEDTRRLAEAPDIATANAYLELGWRLVDKYVTTRDVASGAAPGGEPAGDEAPGDDAHRREEQIHFVLAWQRDEDPPMPGIDATSLPRKHITPPGDSEEVRIDS